MAVLVDPKMSVLPASWWKTASPIPAHDAAQAPPGMVSEKQIPRKAGHCGLRIKHLRLSQRRTMSACATMARAAVGKWSIKMRAAVIASECWRRGTSGIRLPPAGRSSPKPREGSEEFAPMCSMRRYRILCDGRTSGTGVGTGGKFSRSLKRILPSRAAIDVRAAPSSTTALSDHTPGDGPLLTASRIGHVPADDYGRAGAAEARDSA